MTAKYKVRVSDQVDDIIEADYFEVNKDGILCLYSTTTNIPAAAYNFWISVERLANPDVN